MQPLDAPVSPWGLQDILLATGPGKVGTLLADGDWLFFSASQSNGDLRRYFNHLCYRSRLQQAAPHATSFLSVCLFWR